MRAMMRRIRERFQLPANAVREARIDSAGLPLEDPGIQRFVEEGMGWLMRAQDCTASGDDGVARDYSLVRGWATSYPETTGYIVPTFLAWARLRSSDEARERARRMLDWLVSIQLKGGGFQGGRIDAQPVVPVTFNTGQILLGLAAGEAEFGTYREPMLRGARWLAESLDDDGCWRRHPTPFAAPGEKVYETHVSWGLFEAERIAPGQGFGEAGLRQTRWAIGKQRENGWFERCCLTDPTQPLTHTLGYALRGVVEAFLLSGSEEFLGAARRTAAGLLGALELDGRLPGRLDASWQGTVPWVCLTGTAQVAHSWLLLHEVTGEEALLDGARRANRYVRRTMRVEGPPETRGGIKGSFPVDGDYGRFEYLNWAVKFAVDSNLLEDRVVGATAASFPQ